MAGASNYVTVSRRPPDIEDYIDMVRRYRSWIIGPMFAGLVISVVVAFLWQDTYVSTAVMQITPQQISSRLVPSDYSTEMQDRLNQMQQEILSRGSLGELVQRPSLDLYPKDRLRRPLEDVVQDMRNKDISIKMVELPVTSRTGDAGKMLASAFTISFKYTDRFKAQQVVRELVSKFVEQNVKVQTEQARMTTNFIDDELKNAKKNLDDQDARLTKWKIENPGKLPEQFAANQTAYQGAQMEAQRLGDALAHAQTQKLMIEQQIRNTNADQEYYSQHSEDVIMGQGLSVKNQQLVNIDDRLTQAKMALAAMTKQVGEKYPAVSELKAQIETLEDQKAELEKEQAAKDAEAASATPTTTRVVNPQVQQRLVEIKNNIGMLKTQLASTQQEIDSIIKSQAEINRRIAAYQALIEAMPIGVQQYQQLLTDYNLAQQAYDTQMKKKEESETQQNLEEHKAGQQLVPLDQANLPETPVEPNRPVWAAVGTIIGLMIGIVLAAVKEMKDASLKNLKDVRAYTNLPVLSSIPLLENALLVRRKRRLFWLAWSASFIFGSLAMSASMYYHFFGRSN
ncbi:MAG TPA: GNVR domain-containing protein [Bryobacteraceae bacterium]|nr:GNVR domain-containing protein [Bryobacteraceae bacterium]